MTYKIDYEKLQRMAFNKKGMSVSALLESAGLNRSRGSEMQKRTVQARTVFKIAQALGVEPSELIKED